MPLTVPTWVGAIAAVVLALGAIVTSIFAIRAFGQQTQELGVLRQQAKDQAEMLRVQSGQLDAQRDQFQQQRKVNEKQTEVLDLQAQELRESLAERLEDREQRRRAQASQVYIELHAIQPPEDVPAVRGLPEPDPLPWRLNAKVSNVSDQPVYDVIVSWLAGSRILGSSGSPARIMPGQSAHFEREVTVRSGRPQQWLEPGTFGAVVVFWDAARVRWQIKEDGALTEITPSSADIAEPQE